MKDEKPTSFDIAFLAGVSQPTVSRALRNSPLVNEETRRKVQEIARQLNYKVDKNARNLRSKQTKTLALLLFEDAGTGDSLINPFFLSMLGSITRASSQAGFDLLVSFQQFSDDWHADFEDSNRADGIIFLGYGDYIPYVERLHKLKQAGAHFITWGPVVEGQPGVSIGCDNVNGGRVATEHLLSLGRRRIAYIGGIGDGSPEFLQRYEGHIAALQALNVEVDSRFQVDAESTEDSGYRAAKMMLERGLSIDGIFGASDLIAIGAMKALQEVGLRVPKDVSVVGFDDISMASYTNPSLTTIQQNTRLAGELLVENLLKQIEGEQPESFLIPAGLIIRQSCGAPD